MLDFSNHKITSKGLVIPGAAEALRKNREMYPTYDDLLKRHNEHFKIIERIRNLGL